MILAGQLSGLLDIIPPAQILLFDLRSPSEFQRSHIHSAVNLRLPSKYLRTISLDRFDRTFPDEQSRRSFTRWSKTKCMVVYDRNIESSLECPTAPALLDMLRRQGWPGRCFVLKGPFREFSMSFDKYIMGDKMTKQSKTYTDSLRSATPPSEDQLRRNKVRYEEWLRRVQHEGSLQQATNYSTPREVTTKKAAVDEHQRELEAEFRGRFPELYRKIRDADAHQQQQCSAQQPPAPPPKHGKEALYDDDSYFDTRKAHLVCSLSAGLDKLRDNASSSAGSSGYSFPNERQPDKLGELPSLDYDDFDEIDPREAQSPYGGGGGRSPAPSVAPGPAVTPLDYAAKRVAREALGTQGIWKRWRSNGGK